ncbi:uncharacterized protein LOC127285916 [Leptopilina boulardi]|uniref:uncharacterized protein LOC127285916 n=1 Tax=Leptopilina boulardi TaxID=63433 RepID=UPI0021F5F558|nr:uncharacterized protein LOC127285916 [Leptopilina boulardi]
MLIVSQIIPACLLVTSGARRVQIRPRVSEPQVYYEEEDNQQAEDEYEAPIYQPRARALPSPRSKDTLQGSKAPPVQTIRNYNKVNDDGSFTFGYEAADGSFKEETRGTDCVVRGKYGYVDPDGNKREFTYVSGNPCDPNAPKDEDDLADKEEEVVGPPNYPSSRPIQRPVRPNYPATTPRAPTTIFQTEYQLDDDASQELEEVSRPAISRPSAFRRPVVRVTEPTTSGLYQPIPTSEPVYRLASSSTLAGPRYQIAQTTPTPQRSASPSASTIYQPIEASTRATTIARQRPQSVAITPRPHVAQVAAQYVGPSSTERPGVVFAPRTYHPTSATTSLPPRAVSSTPPPQNLDFAAELERYVNSVALSSPTARPVPKAKASPSAEPIYQSELVYDPATGQYNTQLYQSLPQTMGDISLSHKLQPFVAQPQQLAPIQRQNPIYRQPSSSSSQIARQPQEAIYRKQQAEIFQQSQQLYAQQQRRQQQPQRFQLLDPQRDAQSFYYVQSPPQGQHPGGQLSAGQIDQFLRGNAEGF